MNPFLRLSLFSLILLLQNFLAAQEPMRTWTSSDGRTLEARFIEQVGSNVKIKTAQGREFTLPITRFSQEDQEYIKQIQALSFFKKAAISFEDDLKGAVIATAIRGKVEVIDPPLEISYGKIGRLPSRIIKKGTIIDPSSIVKTGNGSSVSLLFTNGSIGTLNENSSLLVKDFWQSEIRPSNRPVNEQIQEISPSRIHLNLELGDLVVDVKKLDRSSNFRIETSLGVAGIRGTSFRISSMPQENRLLVREGLVEFLNKDLQVSKVSQSQKLSFDQTKDSTISPMSKEDEIKIYEELDLAKKNASSFSINELMHASKNASGTEIIHVAKAAGDMKFIFCPSGIFKMGAMDENLGRGYEKPAHFVTITKGFYLGKFEVSQFEWMKIMTENPSNKFISEKNPVGSVTWNAANEFCRKLTDLERKAKRLPEGWHYTLPTEAEWEYACRAGTMTPYYFGQEITKQQVNFGTGKPTPVGSLRPNNWGFYDMHGNVWEWVNDWMSNFTASRKVDPMGPAKGESKVYKGGCFVNNLPYENRSTSRYYRNPATYKYAHVGFRVAFKRIQ